MPLDGQINNSVAFWGWLAAFVVGANWHAARTNPRPPLSRYRKDGGLPWVAFWNLFDSDKFTPEAIEFHRRTIRSIPLYLGVFAAGWLLLDMLW
jgi:hypothetical protein